MANCLYPLLLAVTSKSTGTLEEYGRDYTRTVGRAGIYGLHSPTGAQGQFGRSGKP